jgi:hypothetical protein
LRQRAARPCSPPGAEPGGAALPRRAHREPFDPSRARTVIEVEHVVVTGELLIDGGTHSAARSGRVPRR